MDNELELHVKAVRQLVSRLIETNDLAGLMLVDWELSAMKFTVSTAILRSRGIGNINAV